ncbi:MAG: DUF2058 domain-containing protein [Pseudohongiella sp.]|nr:DUF2058 domain-containing protein [Pseudohongiella sp.]MDO9519682.1 DUF2058 domain-containing protein [Pseudohongiella sp.]MDP2128248.1 DUF2058 domain-containing protein [Pseudohongiella sp.]
MGKSLADQLLSAGLVDARKVKQLQQEKRKEQKHQPKGQMTAQAELKQKAEQARAQKTEQDRLLNEQRLQAERLKEMKVQVRQILQLHTVPAAGEIRFNFKDANSGKIRYLFVTETQQNLLAAGQLLICANGKRAVLVSRETAERIKERLPDVILFDALIKQGSSELDEAYKDFPIPDDLDW